MEQVPEQLDSHVLYDVLPQPVGKIDKEELKQDLKKQRPEHEQHENEQ